MLFCIFIKSPSSFHSRNLNFYGVFQNICTKEICFNITRLFIRDEKFHFCLSALQKTLMCLYFKLILIMNDVIVGVMFSWHGIFPIMLKIWDLKVWGAIQFWALDSKFCLWRMKKIFDSQWYSQNVSNTWEKRGFSSFTWNFFIYGQILLSLPFIHSVWHWNNKVYSDVRISAHEIALLKFWEFLINFVSEIFKYCW